MNPVRVGNAAAPRWWDLEPTRLDAFLEHISAHGARGGELVLHHGPADDRTSRVHVLAERWDETFAAFRRHGLAVDAHASLDDRFRIARWQDDASGVRATYLPMLAALAAHAETQEQPVTLVIHGCDGEPDRARELADAARGFIDWAAGWIADADARLRLAVELRQARSANDLRPDRNRESLLALVADADPAVAGICWDVGHDWENSRFVSGWQPEPDAAFLQRVTHIHLHDAGEDASVHHPLDHERVPWPAQLRAAAEGGYTGAVTMEIRYRYALALGDPWTVLGRSYERATSLLGGGAHAAAGVDR